MGIPRGSGLLACSHPLPRSPWNLNRKMGVAPLPRPQGVRDSGLWGNAHIPCKVTGTGQGKCSLDSLKARPQGDRGQRDKHTRHHTMSPEKEEDNINPSRRYVLWRWDPSRRKTRWCPDSSSQEAATHGDNKEEKQNQQRQCPHCTQPQTVVTQLLLMATRGHARSHPTRDI